MSEILNHARRYRDLGWSIFPVGEGSKAPAVKEWKKYQSEPPTQKQVDGWWRRGKRGVAMEAACRLIDYKMWVEHEAKECERVMAELKNIIKEE